MRFALDLDGVFADFTSAYAAVIRELSGRDIPPNEPNEWDWLSRYGVTPAEEAAAWRIIHAEPTFWLHLRPMAGAVEALKQLRLLDPFQSCVHFVTNRPKHPAVQHLTEEWLGTHGYPHARVILACQKGLIAKLLKVDVFADDRPSNCQDVLDSSPATTVCLVARPWNRDAQAQWASTPDSVEEPTVRVIDDIWGTVKELAA